MGKALIGLAMNAGKNIVAALITKKMLLWALERYARSTETEVDDHAVDLVQAGVDNDQVGIRQAVKGLSDVWLDK